MRPATAAGPNDAALTRLLHAAQDAYGYLTPEILENLASSAGARIGDVLRVYGAIPHLQTNPVSKGTVVVCMGKPCQSAGGARLAEKLGLKTRTVRCLGCCAYAPAMVKDGRVTKAPTVN